tara:strand:+ start:404 stop:1477 length:1074 start_codon:yes stop_codon:yes gene_type:complete
MKKSRPLKIISCFVGAFFVAACTESSRQNKFSRSLLVGVDYESVGDSYTFQSTLEARDEVKLSAQVIGRIKSIDVQEGSQVKKNQLLYTLDQANAKKLLEAQQAKAKFDANDAKKYDYLRERGVIPEMVRNQFQTKAESSKALAEALKADLDYRNITSPIDGVVSSIGIKVGSVTNIGEPIFSIIDNSKLEARVSIPLSLSKNIRIDQPVYLYSKQTGREIQSGRINFISPLADKSTQTFLVKAILINNEGRLMHNQNVTLKIKAPNRRRLVIPDQAIFRDSGQAFVIKAVSLKHARKILNSEIKVPKKFSGLIAMQTPIQAISLGNSQSEVVSGLQNGDQIVAKNPRLISNGSLID